MLWPKSWTRRVQDVNRYKTLASFSLIAILGTTLVGCGSSPAKSATSASAPSAHGHRPHKHGHGRRHRLVRTKGAVVSVSSTHLVIKTSTGAQKSFTLSSHTKYRQKRQKIALSAIHTGAAVTVLTHTTPKKTRTLLVRLP